MYTEYKNIDNIIKEYSHMFKVIKYHKPLLIRKNYDKVKSFNLKQKQIEDSSHRSARRTKSIIKDYTLSNDFEWFITFTFDPKKVNRYSLSACSLKMQGWLSRVRHLQKDTDSPPFKYIVVPELHKDGAIHFHALFSGYPKKFKSTQIIQDNKRVYNLPYWRFGFTNATKISDTQIAFAYLTKYITKEMVHIHGKKRYWASKNLQKPITYHNKLKELGLENNLTDETMQFENQYSLIYQIPKFD